MNRAVNPLAYDENFQSTCDDSRNYNGLNPMDNMVHNEAYEAIKYSAENIYEALQ